MNEQAEFWNTIADDGLFLSFIPTALYAFRYTFRRPRRKGFVGIANILIAWSLMMIQLVVGASLFFGVDYPFRPLFRNIGYWSLFLAMTLVYITFEIESHSASPVIDAWLDKVRCRIRRLFRRNKS